MGGSWRAVTRKAFEERFACDVGIIPKNVTLLGWRRVSRLRRPGGIEWSAFHEDEIDPAATDRRIGDAVRFLSSEFADALGERGWSLACFSDGWRERRGFAEHHTWVEPTPDKIGFEWWGGPGEVPILSPTQPGVLCFAAHRGDPSAVLLPEANFLMDGYRRLFREIRRLDVAWSAKSSTFMFSGGDHGDVMNVPGHASPSSRRFLFDRVAAEGLPVEVRLGGPANRQDQLRHRYLLNTDGMIGTWDGFAWKLLSRSLLLSVDTFWQTSFTDQFTPWEHYVPIARDLSDLAERIEWCLGNEGPAEQMARAGSARAAEVYTYAAVAEALRPTLAAHLSGHGPRVT
jgi:hypothetical protein